MTPAEAGYPDLLCPCGAELDVIEEHDADPRDPAYVVGFANCTSWHWRHCATVLVCVRGTLADLRKRRKD